MKQLPKTVANVEDARQLVRSFGSVGANYIEANECIGRTDFIMKIKTCRREAKESIYCLRLVKSGDVLEQQRRTLSGEAVELMKIFGAIARKSDQ